MKILGKKRKNPKKVEKPFLLKLYTILNDESCKKYIQWSSEGLSFIIINENNFTKKVLPKFFNHRNFSSFVRQLNMYHFHKEKSPQKGECEYKHAQFQKSKTIKEILLIKKDDEKPKSKIDKTESLKDQLGNLEEESKINIFKEVLKKGELSNDSNEIILNYLLDKSKESIKIQKIFENEIKDLKLTNSSLREQLQMYNTKLNMQNEKIKKMKGMIIYQIYKFYRNKKNKENIEEEMNNSNENRKFIQLIYKYKKYKKYKSSIESSYSFPSPNYFPHPYDYYICPQFLNDMNNSNMGFYPNLSVYKGNNNDNLKSSIRTSFNNIFSSINKYNN